MEIIQEYKNAVVELIEATHRGAINWTRQNPSTLYIEMKTASGATAIMSIQQVRPERGYFVFNVRNASDKEMVISIDSSKNHDFRGMLDELYHVANYSVEKRSLDFLNDIIGGIKKK